ncbi:MAG: hypothetical protein GXY68_11940 [Chloroflexi bacterium]|nr:hypothetical protein [Chloroflexota bacterium]
MTSPSFAHQLVDVGLLLLLGAWASLLLLLEWRRRPQTPMRVPRLYAQLRVAIDRAIETGRSIHLALGSRSLPDAADEATVAMALVHATLQERDHDATPNLVSCGDGTLYALAAGAAPTSAAHAIMLGVEQAGYAVGAWRALAGQRLAGQMLAGPTGAEGLLLAEGRIDAAPDGLAGAARMDDAGVLMLGSSAWVVGEDYYAASAHSSDPSHTGGLALQDIVRLLLVLVMLAGLALRLLGWWGI